MGSDSIAMKEFEITHGDMDANLILEVIQFVKFVKFQV